MKKVMALLISLLLCLLLVLNGCAKTQAPGAAATDTSKQETAIGPVTYPLVKDKITLSAFRRLDPTIEDMDTNELTKEMEALTNVHINWILASDKDMEQKRNLLLASGTGMPDMFLIANLTNTQQIQYGSQGILLPLNDLIDKYAYNTKKLLTENPEVKKMITAPDGKIYSLPQYAPVYHTSLSQKLWINQDWLTKLNLKMPTTTDELYTVLKAFKEKDPNGNGKADEIPLTGAITGYNLWVYHFIMNAFIEDRGFDQRPLNLKDGKVSAAFDKPEWQEGLRYLNKLYKDGLLDRGAVTQDNNQIKQLADKKEAVLLGAVTAGARTGFLNATSDRQSLYTSVPPIKGPKGVQTTFYNPYQIVPGRFSISKDCKYPDVAIKWVDYFSSVEGSLRAQMGRKDVEWRYAKPGEMGMNGKQGSYVRLLKFGNIQNVHWNGGVPTYIPAEVRDAAVAEPTDQETILFHESREKYAPFAPKEVLPPLFMTAEESEEYSAMDFTIVEYLKETMARFTIGDLNIDTDWANYLKELDKMGLKKYVEMTQKAYDRQFKK